MRPRVSTAIGTKVYVCASCRYLAVFLSAAASAAPPEEADVTGRYDCATVSVTVTSQVTLLPFCQGMRELLLLTYLLVQTNRQTDAAEDITRPPLRG